MVKAKVEIKKEPEVDTKEKPTLEQTVEMLASIVNKVVDSVDKIEEKLNTPQEPVQFKAPENKGSDYKPTGYVPAKYRQIVDEVLSPEFGLDCIENSANMDFEIKIVVPEAYSSLTTQEKQLGVQDIRSKVISRALGENGVRDWCVKVRENLNRFYSRSGVQSPFTTNVLV